MKIAIFSDIHGNLNALETVLNHISFEGITEMYCLGDLLNGGCGGDVVVDLLIKNQVKCLRGNHDTFVLDADDNQFPANVFELVSKMRDWTVNHTSASSINYLSKLPIEIKFQFPDSRDLYFCHATPDSLWVLPPLLCESDAHIIFKAYGNVSADFIFHGHHHGGTGVRIVVGKTIVNVSSVGMNSDHLANYTVVESNEGQLCIQQNRVAYDWQGELERMRDCNYPTVIG